MLTANRKNGSGYVAGVIIGILVGSIVVFVLVRYLIWLRLWITEKKLHFNGKLSSRATQRDPGEPEGEGDCARACQRFGRSSYRFGILPHTLNRIITCSNHAFLWFTCDIAYLLFAPNGSSETRLRQRFYSSKLCVGQ